MVKLSEFVENLTRQNFDYQFYIHFETGEMVGVFKEMVINLEDGEIDWENIPDWQKEDYKKVERVVFEEEYIKVPDPYEIHEYRIMEDFIGTIESEQLRWDLEDAIRGKGAFQRFKTMTSRYDLVGEWQDFKTQALAVLGRNWLGENKIKYMDDIS